MRSLISASLCLCVSIGPAYAQPAQAPPWSFRCPAADTIVEANNNIRFHFRGADSTHPLICRSGTDTRRALGIWDMRTAVFREGMNEIGTLFPATTGRSVAVNYFSTDVNQNSVAVRDVFRIVGFPRITVPAGPYQTIQIERFSEFTTSRGGVYQRRDTVWLSTRDGLPVKATYEQVSGTSPTSRLADWEAVRVIRPAPRPAG